MADMNPRPLGNDLTVQQEDLVGTASRLNWGPIFAGAVLALSLYFLLSLDRKSVV